MSGDDLGLVEYQAPTVDRGDVVELPNGHDAIVTARVETGEESVAALLEVAVAPSFEHGRRPWSRRSAESGP
jgi:hypothetical protein